MAVPTAAVVPSAEVAAGFSPASTPPRGVSTLPSEPLAPRSRPGDLVASGDRSTRVSLSVLGEGFGPLSAKAEVAGRQIALAATTATAV